MKNILLLCPSLYRENAPKQSFSLYGYPEISTSVYHTNIPVFESIVHHLKEEGGQLDHILMLSSEEVCNSIKHTEYGRLTTLEYLKSHFQKCCEAIGMENIPVITPLIIGTGEIKDTAKLQLIVNNAVASLGADQANIWVDFTSGLRSYAIMLIFMIRFLEMRKHCVKDILYANLNNSGANTIDSCLKVYQLFETYEALDSVKSYANCDEDQASIFPQPLVTLEDQALDSLRQMYYDLEMKLNSDIRKHAGMIRESKRIVEETVSRFPENPHIALMAERIRQKFPQEDDCYTEIEYKLMHGDVNEALLRFKESAFENLVNTGVIILNGRGNWVEMEVVSAYLYYIDFLSYIQSILRELESNLELEPMAHFKDHIHGALERRYDAGIHEKYKFRSTMNAVAREQFHVDFKVAIEKKDESYRKECEQLRATIVDSEVCEAEVKAVSAQYHRKSEAYEQLYMRSGFPMVCTDYQKHEFVYSFYRPNLFSKVLKMVRALQAVKQGVWDDGVDKMLGMYSFSHSDYQAALCICMDHLQSVIPLDFSYRKPDNVWLCGLKDKNALRRFLLEYLPIHAKIRELRNQYAHDNLHKSSLPPELSMDEKKALVLKGIQMMRTIAQQERI